MIKMPEILSNLQLSTSDWVLAYLCAILVGFAKTGISGTGILVVPLIACVFPARQSVGILLPMLCMADFFAVKYYHRHADWKLMLKPMPWAVLGILLGVYVGKDLNSDQFRYIIGGLVLAILIFMVLREKYGKIGENIPDNWYFAVPVGLLGGFTTMVGNAAGPVWTIYLLAMRLPKYAFIGTGAWFFLILNHFKVPFHIFSWETITWQSFAFDLAMIPGIVLGAFLGVYTVKRINENIFRHLIQVLAIIAAIKLLLPDFQTIKDLFS